MGTRTGGFSIPGIGNTGCEFGLRETSAQIDDLKRKLKMVIIMNHWWKLIILSASDRL